MVYINAYELKNGVMMSLKCCFFLLLIITCLLLKLSVYICYVHCIIVSKQNWFSFGIFSQLLSEVASLHIDVRKPCESCGNIGENWVCLICSVVMCSRYVKSHMVAHNAQSGHMLVLSFSDLSVWCYVCDSCKSAFGSPAMIWLKIKFLKLQDNFNIYTN